MSGRHQMNLSEQHGSYLLPHGCGLSVCPSWITSVQGVCPAGKTWLLWRKQTGGWKVSWMCLCTPPLHQGVYTHTHTRTYLADTHSVSPPPYRFAQEELGVKVNYYCTAGSRI